MQKSFLVRTPNRITSLATSLAIILFLLPAMVKAQESTDVLPFNTVKLLGLIEVEFIQGDVEKVEIRAFGEDASKVKISQQNKTLKISTLKSLVNEDLDIRVKVYFKSLEAVYVAAGANVTFNQVVKQEDFFIRASSGSEVYLEVECERLEAHASEGSFLTIRGSASKLNVGATTGGILDGHRLSCTEGRMRAGTGGEVSAQVNDELDARANTGGIIRYAGNPALKAKKTILGGEIYPLVD